MKNRRTFITRVAATAAGVAGITVSRDTFGNRPHGHYLGRANASGARPEFIQPDYDAWARVQAGMSEAEVLRILGEPLDRGKPPEKSPLDNPSVIRVYRWVYGRIDFRSPLVPVPDEFYIHLGNGRVFEKHDPFGTLLSSDGKPTVPRLIYPISGAAYDHYPRYLDLRWYPSSGQYPIHYVVEHQIRDVSEDGKWEVEQTMDMDIPYQLIEHTALNPGRWRVKAVNALGESIWSEYRAFKFDV